jgi:predicted nucleotidyltransferase component of viral defense system
MRPLRLRLEQTRKRLNIPWDVLERDYLLSWMLAGIGQVEALRDSFVFKGGTALKKCYFGDYRFSEDLDFSTIGNPPTGAAMEDAIRQACKNAATLLDEYIPVEIHCERYIEKEPHPAGQEAFAIRARLPWQKEPFTRVMIETTMDEKVLKRVRKQPVFHEYGEPFDAEVLVYSLEEIVAEKLRAILQHIEKLEQRGWSRSRARDYYDLWRVFGVYKDQMDLSDYVPFLRAKCAVRNVRFRTADDFFREPMLTYVGKTWNQWLGPLVPGLPQFDTVISELRPQIESLLPT